MTTGDTLGLQIVFPSWIRGQIQSCINVPTAALGATCQVQHVTVWDALDIFRILHFFHMAANMGYVITCITPILLDIGGITEVIMEVIMEVITEVITEVEEGITEAEEVEEEGITEAEEVGEGVTEVDPA